MSAYGRRNSKPRHCAYIRTILIVAWIFSAYVRGYSKSRHCAYIRTFLIVARIFCAYVRGNSKSRRCAYIRTTLIVERIHSAYVRGYSKSRQCAYMRTILIERESFFCVRTRKLQISSLFVYAHNLNSSAFFLRTYMESKSSNCAYNRNNRVLFSV